MDEFEIRPREIPEAGEGIESTEQQALDDSTFEPGAFAERTGDYQQSETIQRDFTGVVESADSLPQDESLADRQPRMADGPFEPAPSGGDDGGDEATPINLPGPQTSAAIGSQPVNGESLHARGEIYYTHETGSGPVPHTYAGDAPQEEDGTRDWRMGMPNGEDDGGWLDGGSSEGNTLEVDLIEGVQIGAEEGHPPMPEDQDAGPQGDEPEEEWLERLAAGRTLAGIEEQDTVLGRQPTMAEGPFEPAPVAGDQGQSEAIPITLPELLGVGSTDDVISRAMNLGQQEGSNDIDSHTKILEGLRTLEEQLQAARTQKQNELLEAQKGADEAKDLGWMKGLTVEEIVALGMESRRIAHREEVAAENYQAPAHSSPWPSGHRGAVWQCVHIQANRR